MKTLAHSYFMLFLILLVIMGTFPGSSFAQKKGEPDAENQLANAQTADGMQVYYSIQTWKIQLRTLKPSKERFKKVEAAMSEYYPKFVKLISSVQLTKEQLALQTQAIFTATSQGKSRAEAYQLANMVVDKTLTKEQIAAVTKVRTEIPGIFRAMQEECLKQLTPAHQSQARKKFNVPAPKKDN